MNSTTSCLKKGVKQSRKHKITTYKFQLELNLNLQKKIKQLTSFKNGENLLILRL